MGCASTRDLRASPRAAVRRADDPFGGTATDTGDEPDTHQSHACTASCTCSRRRIALASEMLGDPATPNNGRTAIDGANARGGLARPGRECDGTAQ